MNIGIDARLIWETGVGRYIRNLIRELSQIDGANTYVVFLRKNEYETFVLPNARWKKVCADVAWHSLKEQFMLPLVFMREGLSVLHVPYFNAPIFYPKPFVLTIHDLTILHVDTGKASTLPPLLYKLKRLGYELVLRAGVKKAKHILTVSETIRDDIVRELRVPPQAIMVTYEGVDPIFLNSANRKKVNASEAKGSYFLYVGNAYPHKNIETLLDGYERYVKKTAEPLKFIMVGKDDFFYRRLREQIDAKKLTQFIDIRENVEDRALVSLYANARALVFPSLMEGFGLPALEATACGCHVLCSDLPIFHEILGNFATYMDSSDANGIAKHLRQLSQAPIAVPPAARLRLKKFSWRQLALKTLAVYEYGAKFT